MFLRLKYWTRSALSRLLSNFLECAILEEDLTEQIIINDPRHDGWKSSPHHCTFLWPPYVLHHQQNKMRIKFFKNILFPKSENKYMDVVILRQSGHPDLTKPSYSLGLGALILAGRNLSIKLAFGFDFGEWKSKVLCFLSILLSAEYNIFIYLLDS